MSKPIKLKDEIYDELKQIKGDSFSDKVKTLLQEYTTGKPLSIPVAIPITDEALWGKLKPRIEKLIDLKLSLFEQDAKKY